MKRYLFVIFAVAVLAACSSTPTKEQDAATVEDRGASSAGQKPPADHSRDYFENGLLINRPDLRKIRTWYGFLQMPVIE